MLLSEEQTPDHRAVPEETDRQAGRQRNEQTRHERHAER